MSMQGLVARLGIDHSGFGAGLKGAGGELAAFANRVRSTASRLALPAGIVAGTGIAAATRAINAAREQAAVENKLRAVINATGHAAGFTAGQMIEYAGELQRVTNFGDEATISAQAVLATFKEIKGQTFKDAIASAQDMAAVMGSELQPVVIAIGKALNDPIQGVTALRRVGVSFNEEQLTTIKRLQETGDMAGAQAVVLKELQSEFGGAARAMADPIVQLQNAVSDLSQTIGLEMLPSVQLVAKALTDYVSEANAAAGASEGFSEPSAELIDNLAMLASVGQYAAGIFFGLRSGVTDLIETFVTLAKPLAFFSEEWSNTLDTMQSELRRFVKEDEERADKLLFGDSKNWGKETRDRLIKAREELNQQREQTRNLKGLSAGNGLAEFGEQATGRAGGLSEGAKDAQRAARLFEETRTPIERLQERLREARRLFAEGIISTDVFQRSRSAIIDEAKKLSDEIYKPLREAREALESDAKRMIEETRTPIEKLRAEWERAKEAFGAKLIDNETFGRKLTELQKQAAELGGGESDRAPRKLEGLQAGSKESLSALIAFNKQGKADSDANKKTEQNTRRTNQLLTEMNRNLVRQLDALEEENVFQIPG